LDGGRTAEKDVDAASHVETLLDQLSEAPASFMADSSKLFAPVSGN